MIKTWQQRCEGHLDHEGIVTHQIIMERMQEEIDELRQALAQPVDAVNISQKRVDKTAKGKHKWVGLTDDERKQIVSYIRDPIDWVPAVEAKLKEKNCA